MKFMHYLQALFILVKRLARKAEGHMPTVV